MKTPVTLALVVLCAVLSTTGCYYDVEEELYPVTTCDTVDMSFDTDIVAILQRECLACHSNSAHQGIGGGVNLDGFDNVKRYVNNGKLLSSIIHDGNASFMPKSANNRKLATCEIDKITAWINDGARKR